MFRQFTWKVIKGLFNNYVKVSCLYAKFPWLISHDQVSFQSQSVNVMGYGHRLVTETEICRISQRYVIIELHPFVGSTNFYDDPLKRSFL